MMQALLNELQRMLAISIVIQIEWGSIMSNGVRYRSTIKP